MIPISTVMAVSDTLAACRSTVYVEERSPFHDELTKKVWAWVKERVDVVYPGAPILDLGCGNGPFLQIIEEEGIKGVGITASPEEFAACDKQAFDVLQWDMHDVSQLTNYASGIWLRHALEHSPMPLILLRSCRAALKAGGWIYIEVPAPGTSSKHEENANHFSVLGQVAWRELILRAGFNIIDSASIKFRTQLGEDEYFCFLARS